MLRLMLRLMLRRRLMMMVGVVICQQSRALLEQRGRAGLDARNVERARCRRKKGLDVCA